MESSGKTNSGSVNSQHTQTNNDTVDPQPPEGKSQGHIVGQAEGTTSGFGNFENLTSDASARLVTNDPSLPGGSSDAVIVKAVKKYSSVWIIFQKVKRFVRTIAMGNDSKNITSKNAKEIPSELIDCLNEIQSNGHFSDTDEVVTKIDEYNKNCKALQACESEIHELKLGSDKDQLKEKENNLIQIQNKILSLSKEIFTFTDTSIKWCETNIKDLNTGASKKDYKKFFDVLKNNIGFDVNKVTNKQEEKQQALSTNTFASLEKLFKSKKMRIVDTESIKEKVTEWADYQKINNFFNTPRVQPNAPFNEVPDSCFLKNNDNDPINNCISTYNQAIQSINDTQNELMQETDVEKKSSFSGKLEEHMVDLNTQKQALYEMVRAARNVKASTIIKELMKEMFPDELSDVENESEKADPKIDKKKKEIKKALEKIFHVGDKATLI